MKFLKRGKGIIVTVAVLAVVLCSVMLPISSRAEEPVESTEVTLGRYHKDTSNFCFMAKDVLMTTTEVTQFLADGTLDAVIKERSELQVHQRIDGQWQAEEVSDQMDVEADAVVATENLEPGYEVRFVPGEGLVPGVEPGVDPDEPSEAEPADGNQDVDLNSDLNVMGGLVLNEDDYLTIYVKVKNDSTEPVVPPTDPVNPPTDPVNPPTDPVTPPTEPVNPPTDPVTPPVPDTTPVPSVSVASSAPAAPASQTPVAQATATPTPAAQTSEVQTPEATTEETVAAADPVAIPSSDIVTPEAEAIVDSANDGTLTDGNSFLKYLYTTALFSICGVAVLLGCSLGIDFKILKWYRDQVHGRR